MVGIAWDWREVLRDVVVMADPMSILSNVKFVDEEGEEFDDADRLLQLNTAVYNIPWQNAVCTTKRKFLAAMAD